MQRVIRLIAVVWCVLVGLQASPTEARRVALVIGNADYKLGPLQNPVNDATAVAEVLAKQLRFDKVILKKNLTFDGFRAALIEMGREWAGAELGMVYFAGHGTEIGGRNFLIPVDATLAKTADLDLEAVALDSVLKQLSAVTKLKLVILDACRSNLFPLAGVDRHASRGLARVEPEDNNTVIAYAAKHGTTAADGVGRKHSPFTEALLKHIATPALEIRFLLGEVRDDVMATTRSVQQPHVYQSLGREKFFLLPPAPKQPDAERAWAAVKDTKSLSALEVFITHYSNTFYADLARERIEQLKKQKVEEPDPLKTVKTAPPPPYKVLDPRPEPPPSQHGLSEILLTPGNVVPECVTPGRLMAFLKARNPELNPRYDSIASEYMRLGELLGVRWDFAFYQMIVETGALSYWRGTRAGDVKPEQNNFVGLGATGKGEPGESYKDMETGVRAHLEHLLLYAGRPVANPVAERTRKLHSWGMLTAWQKTFTRPITYADLATRWSGNRHYGNLLHAVAERFHSDVCKVPDPRPGLLVETRRAIAKARAK